MLSCLLHLRDVEVARVQSAEHPADRFGLNLCVELHTVVTGFLRAAQESHAPEVVVRSPILDPAGAVHGPPEFVDGSLRRGHLRGGIVGIGGHVEGAADHHRQHSGDPGLHRAGILAHTPCSSIVCNSGRPRSTRGPAGSDGFCFVGRFRGDQSGLRGRVFGLRLRPGLALGFRFRLRLDGGLRLGSLRPRELSVRAYSPPGSADLWARPVWPLEPVPGPARQAAPGHSRAVAGGRLRA